VWLSASGWKSQGSRFWLEEEFYPQSCQKQKEPPGEVESSLWREVSEQMLEKVLAMISKVFPTLRVSEAEKKLP
jgi:hypothetical protein